MTYELRILSQNKNLSTCEVVKGYRKDLKKCINAAQNEISKLTNKNICDVLVTILERGRSVYRWHYIPTMR